MTYCEPNQGRYALTIKEACRFSSLSRSTLYSLASAGRLTIRKVAGRSLILVDDLKALLTPSDQ